MGAFVIYLFSMRAVGKGWRFHLSYTLFLSAMLILSMFRNIICSIYLPPDGSFGGFDHDIAGFRLGGYYLIMVAVSVSLLKYVSAKLRVIAPEPTSTLL